LTWFTYLTTAVDLLSAILAGVTDVYGSPYTTAKSFVDDGKLIGLAVTSSARIPYLPEMPTVAETLPGYEVTTWYGLVVPAGTPAAVRDKLQSAVTQAVSMAETKKRFEELGYLTIRDTTPRIRQILA
jgi:tripartite-type tricarboxylate transporter receptor subunit TctC